MQHSAMVCNVLYAWGEDMNTEPWVSLEQIAEHRKVSTDTIYRWIRARKIPVHRFGRFWRFRVSEVDSCVVVGKAGTGRDVRNGVKQG
jgi:excisionase family DNA binding protein